MSPIGLTSSRGLIEITSVHKKMMCCEHKTYFEEITRRELEGPNKHCRPAIEWKLGARSFMSAFTVMTIWSNRDREDLVRAPNLPNGPDATQT